MHCKVCIQYPTQRDSFHSKIYISGVLRVIDHAAKQNDPSRAHAPKDADRLIELLIADSHVLRIFSSRILHKSEVNRTGNLSLTNDAGAQTIYLPGLSKVAPDSTILLVRQRRCRQMRTIAAVPLSCSFLTWMFLVGYWILSPK